MKKIIAILLFLLIIQICQAKILESDSGILDVTIDHIVTIDNSSKLNMMRVTLPYSAINDSRQKILSLTTDPPSKEQNESLVFEKGNLNKNKIHYQIKIKAEISQTLKIDKKIKFPITSEQEYQQYLMPTKTIDSDNPDIQNLASQIASGNDDLYVIVHKLAAWVNQNIKYDITTTNLEASQKASYVLKNRNGVCDELTNLFIALCRSIGIPARFVSGIAYTNSPLFKDPWQFHGWAEVYFPGYGWLPVDPTYEQIGFLDVSHLKLKVSSDAYEYKIFYEYDGNIKILNTTTKISTNTSNLKNKVRGLDYVFKPYADKVGYGSYNLLTLELINPNKYYVSEALQIADTKEISQLSEKKRFIALLPKKTAKEFWLVKTKKNLDPNYYYVFPFSILTSRNISIMTNFSAIVDGQIFNKDDFEKVMNEYQDVLKQDLFNFQCNNVTAYINTTLNIKCIIHNKGNVHYEDIIICLDEQCLRSSLAINAKKNLTYKLAAEKIGIDFHNIYVKDKNNKVLASGTLKTEVKDYPDAEIIPERKKIEAKYDDNIKLNFIIEKTSISSPKKVNVTIETSRKKQEFSYNELNASKTFNISFKAKDLNKKDNFRITLIYYDDNDKQYNKTISIQTELINLTFGQKLKLYANIFLFKLKNIIKI